MDDYRLNDNIVISTAIFIYASNAEKCEQQQPYLIFAKHAFY